MKRFLITMIILFGLSYANAQPYKGMQGSWEGRLYHSVYPIDRTTAKILTTFHHDYTGTSHMGLVFEHFYLGDHQAGSWAVEAGYTFDSFGKKWKWLEIEPMVNMGMMYYEQSSNWRLQLGVDIGYRLNEYLALHLAYLTGKENYHDTPTVDVRERQHVITLGISLRPYFDR